MTNSISIIIPTLNEGKYLPNLLASIKKQTLQPKEVIVADASSKDNTREVAKKYGAIVANDDHHGGPGGGRNAGAAVATGDILLFLDSDVTLPPMFLEKTLAEFEAKRLAVATCFVRPTSTNKIDQIGTSMMDSYFYAMRSIIPHAGGYCIFVRRTIYEFIHGFDETLVLAEDHDFAQRARKYGKFDFLKSEKVFVSTRRFKEHGRAKTVLKYSTAELNILLGRKMRNPRYGIEFGKHYEK